MEAKQFLVDEGCTDLTLVEDDVVAAVAEGFEKATFLGEEIKVTAEQRLQQRNKPPVTIWSATWETLKASKSFILLALCLLGWFVYRGQISSAVWTGVGLLAWVGFSLGLALPSVYYGKLHRASDWSRWDEVLDLVAKLEGINRFSLVKVPAVELTRNRAKALAGMGRLNEALILFQSCENKPGCPSWLYHGFVGGLYGTAKQYDKALEWAEKSVAMNPRGPGYLDIANQLARYMKDAVKARAALVEAEKLGCPEMAKPWLHRTRGIVAYVEGNYDEARRELETAIDLWLTTAKNQPFKDGNLSVARAYLGCVMAAQGDTARARKALEEAKEYLVATKETELLAECEEALMAKA